MTERVSRRWIVGPYTFEQVERHGFPEPEFPRLMYRFKIDGEGNSELYRTLDRAIVSAVGQKHTGPRGAGGSGVGTAADWFAVMIGLDHVEDEQREARIGPVTEKWSGRLPEESYTWPQGSL
jgi:hypothetical protein